MLLLDNIQKLHSDACIRINSRLEFDFQTLQYFQATVLFYHHLENGIKQSLESSRKVVSCMSVAIHNATSVYFSGVDTER